MPTPAPFQPIPVPRRGVRTDALQKDLGPDFFYASENWVYRDGVYRVRPGFSGIGNGFPATGDRIQGMTNFKTADGDAFVGWATVDELHVTDGATDTLLTPTLTGAETDFSIFRAFTDGTNNILLHVNGVDELLAWDGDTTHNFGVVAGAPDSPVAMMILANRVLLCGLPGIHPAAVDPSAEFDHTTGYSTNRAIMGDTNGRIVAALERGNFQGTIFKDDSIYAAEFTGAADPFYYRMVQEVPGPCSSLAVCNLNFGRLQFYVGIDGNCYIFDGLEAHPMGRHIQKYLLGTWNAHKTDRVTCFYDPDQREVHVLYTEAGNSDNNLGLVLKMPSGEMYPQRYLTRVGNFGGYYSSVGAKLSIPTVTTIGELTGPIGELTLTLAELSGSQSGVVIGGWNGSNAGQLLRFDQQPDCPAFFETGLFQGSKDLSFISTQELEHFLTATRPGQEATISLGVSNYGEDRVFDDVLNVPVTVVLGEEGMVVSGHRTQARFFSMKVRVEISQTARSDVTWRGSYASGFPAGQR